MSKFQLPVTFDRANRKRDKNFDSPKPILGQCWIWPRGKSKGYGTITKKRKVLKAHKLVFEAVLGPVHPGFELDHLCRERSCVNPFHLEPVSHKVNVLRGQGIAAVNYHKVACSKGHLFTPQNTYIHKTGNRRECRTCRASYMRVRRAA